MPPLLDGLPIAARGKVGDVEVESIDVPVPVIETIGHIQILLHNQAMFLRHRLRVFISPMPRGSVLSLNPLIYNGFFEVPLEDFDDSRKLGFEFICFGEVPLDCFIYFPWKIVGFVQLDFSFFLIGKALVLVLVSLKGYGRV